MHGATVKMKILECIYTAYCFFGTLNNSADLATRLRAEQHKRWDQLQAQEISPIPHGFHTATAHTQSPSKWVKDASSPTVKATGK